MHLTMVLALRDAFLCWRTILRGAACVGATLLFLHPIGAAETVHGEYTLTCFPYEEAIKYAAKPGYSKIRKQIGCGEGYGIRIIERGADNCKQCSNGRYMCQGYVIAYCQSLHGTGPAPSLKQSDEAARDAADKPKDAIGQAPQSSWMDANLAYYEWRERESAARWQQYTRRHRVGGTGLGEVLARVPEPKGSRAAERCDEALYTYWDKASSSCKKLTMAEQPNANFNTQYRSGGAGVHVYDFPQRPANGAILRLRRDFKGIPDRIVVSFVDGGQERRMFDTGMVSYTGDHSLPPFSGDRVRVIVTGGGDGTAWNFTLAN